METQLDKIQFNQLLEQWSKEYTIYAPKLFVGAGTFSDTNQIRYGEIKSIEEVVFDEKSNFSYKEVLLPITETLFYFTEDEVKVAEMNAKNIIIFLRSCDLHSVKRLDEIYLRNGFEDIYYKRFRENTKFVVVGCKASFDNCFCVSMGTNTVENYDAYMHFDGDDIHLDLKCQQLLKNSMLDNLHNKKNINITPQFVNDNKTKVNIPENLDLDVIRSDVWNEYSTRCIGCGRCNFVCPTCTCFTMQDIFYKDNPNAGERRRVWASCQVDGYTDMAGGHRFREDMGQRMRFKVLHKIYDFKKRYDYHMCVGCGRCDDVCPEYISFSNCVNKLNTVTKEVK